MKEDDDSAEKEIARLREEKDSVREALSVLGKAAIDKKAVPKKPHRGRPKKYPDEKLFWRYIHLISGSQGETCPALPPLMEAATRRFSKQFRQDHPPGPNEPDLQALWGYGDKPVAKKDSLKILADEFGFPSENAVAQKLKDIIVKKRMEMNSPKAWEDAEKLLDDIFNLSKFPEDLKQKYRPLDGLMPNQWPVARKDDDPCDNDAMSDEDWERACNRIDNENKEKNGPKK